MKTEKVRVSDPQWGVNDLAMEDEVLKEVFGDNPPIIDNDDSAKNISEEETKAPGDVGINSNPQTANTDLAALGLHARPVHLGRPKKEMQLELLGV